MRLLDLIDALEAGTAWREPATLAGTLYAVHPSVEAAWADIRANPLLARSREVLAEKAARFRREPAEPLSFTHYKRFDTDGNRSAYERVYFLHRSRLNTWAILALAGEAGALSELEDAIWLVCDEYTWSLPAHLGGRSLEAALVRGYGACPLACDWPAGAAPVPHDQQIDLFAAETAFALAEILALLGDRLSPVVRARAEALVRDRVLSPLCAPGPAWSWETMLNNWSAVCAGAIGCAAMYLIAEPRRLAPVLHRMMAVMDTFLSSFGQDGACTEGHGYWNYGFGFFITFAERLLARTGGRIDLTADPKVHAIALFQQHVFLGGNRIVSFSDADRTGGWQPGLTHWLRRRFPDVVAPDPAGVQHYGDDPCHRWCADLRGFLWTDPTSGRRAGADAAAGGIDPAKPTADGFESAGPPAGGIGAVAVPTAGMVTAGNTVWLSDAQWLVAHAGVAGRTMHFAAKAGHNDEPHNHNDVGAFLLHLDDEPFLEDMGRGEYTKAYFGPNRFDQPATSSRGHCVPVIGEAVQQAGREHAGRVTGLVLDPAADRLTIECAAAYGTPGLIGLERTFRLCRTGTPQLVLEDRFRLARPGVRLTERFVTFLNPVTDGADVLLPGKWGTLRISPQLPGFRVRLGGEMVTAGTGEPLPMRMVDFIADNAAQETVFRATFCFESARSR